MVQCTQWRDALFGSPLKHALYKIDNVCVVFLSVLCARAGSNRDEWWRNMRMDHVHACVRVRVPTRGPTRGMQQQENFLELRVCGHAFFGSLAQTKLPAQTMHD